MKKRYSYRVYPSTRQRRELAKLFGCCRYIYNQVLSDRQAMFETGLSEEVETASGKTRKTFDANRYTALVSYEKSRKPWLRAVSSCALQQSLRDADQAFKNFFNSLSGKRKGTKIGFPKFKSRFAPKQSARFVGTNFSFDSSLGRVRLSGIGWIKLAYSRPLPSKPSSVTIISRSDGTYECSFVVEVDPVEVEYPSNRHAGIDLGLTHFGIVVYSDGTREKIDNLRFLRNAEKRLKKAQRSLSRKERLSNNYKKQQLIVARQHSKVRNARKDFITKEALRLAKENTSIVVENLNIGGLSKAGGKNAQGRGLRKSVHDVGWGLFLTKLKEYAGDRVISVNPAYTSQTCCVCGVLDGKKPLSEREWTCSHCHSVLDRDYNAAVNILVAARQAETENDCGGSIRLQLAEAIPKEAITRWSDERMV